MTAFTGVLSALLAPSCEALEGEVEAEPPEAGLSSESPKSPEDRESVLL